MTITEKIVKLRKENGLTLKSLARQLGIAESSLRAYEKGRTVPTYVIQEYMKTFQVSNEYLTNDNCINKQVQNINIGRILHLDDESISIIGQLNDNSISGTNINLSKTFNHIIQNLNLPYFVLNFELIDNLEFIVYTILQPICDILGNDEYIKKLIKEEKLKPLLEKIEQKNTNIINILQKYNYFITYYLGYDFSARDMLNSFVALKSFIFSINSKPKFSDLKDYIEDYLTDLEEILRKLESCIRVLKNNINEEIYNYQNNINLQYKQTAVQDWR